MSLAGLHSKSMIQASHNAHKTTLKRVCARIQSRLRLQQGHSRCLLLCMHDKVLAPSAPPSLSCFHAPQQLMELSRWMSWHSSQRSA